MMGFTFVPDDPKAEKGRIRPGVCVCDTCGARLPTGIVGLATHWDQCGGKGNKEALMKAFDRLNERGYAAVHISSEGKITTE